MLPGAPRTPRSCAFGRFQSPTHEMFWLPYRSSWLAPIITCRRPAATRSNTARYGNQPSTMSPSSSIASPSLSSRSGANVARASRAPSDGITPIGLARISPSPRQASAHAATHTSALVAVMVRFR